MSDTKKTIELPWEMIETIVIDEVKDAIRMNIDHVEDFNRDDVLINSLAECLRYFMPIREANEFLSEYGL